MAELLPITLYIMDALHEYADMNGLRMCKMGPFSHPFIIFMCDYAE